MPFWKINCKKLALFALLHSLAWLILFVVVSLNGGDPLELFMIPVALGLGLFTTTIPFISGWAQYRYIERFAKDTTPNSVMPLFGNTGNTVLRNESVWLLLTTPIITGTISGLPATISYNVGGEHSSQSLEIQFYPIYREYSDKEEIEEMTIGLTFWSKLKEDPKPKILEFVTSLKARGYCAKPYGS